MENAKGAIPAPASRKSGSDSMRTETSGADAFAEIVHSASDAITALADRLNALALRVALIGAVDLSEAPDIAIEASLHKLYSLVDSAADQMRRIQKILPVLQASALKTESSPIRPARPSHPTSAV